MSELREPSKLVDVHYAFAETDFGKALAANIRYGIYKPEEVSNKRWQELLGVDVNNLGHLQLSGNIARLFCRRQEASRPGFFEQDEEYILEMAGYIHDWAESIPSVGDINYLHKTDVDEAHEIAQFEAHLAHFYSGDEAEIEALIRRALDEVIFSKDTKLGEAFNAIERLGYVRTGLRAARHVIEGSAPDCEENLRWLVADVLSNNISKLIEYSEAYPPIKDYLIDQKLLVSAAFLIPGTAAFSKYGTAEQQEKRLVAFEENSMDWRQWRIRRELCL